METSHRKERNVTEEDDNFASMFEASIQAKRFDEGQTIEGTIVADRKSVV